MALEGVQEAGNSLDQAIVDLALVLECLDVELALLALGVDLILLGTDKGSLVDVRMNLNIRVIAQLEGVLR